MQELEGQLAQKNEELEAKDKAIVELTMALDVSGNDNGNGV